MLPMIPMMKRMPTNCTAKEAMSNFMKNGARKRVGSQSWRKLRREPSPSILGDRKPYSMLPRGSKG